MLCILDAVVEFEHAEYTVNEGQGSLEVCIRVINPPHSKELGVNIHLDYSTSIGSAGVTKANLV